MKRQTLTIKAMGTINTITLAGAKSVVEATLTELHADLLAYIDLFSANDAASTLMQLNQTAAKTPVVVPELLYQLIKLGKAASIAPTGNLNIALGPLVKLWHIGFSDAKVPKPAQIKAALKKCDARQIILDDEARSVAFDQPGMEIDLGCLAKGYIADLLAKTARRRGIRSGIINLGGNVVVIGKNDATNAAWKIGIQAPSQTFGKNLAVVFGSDVSLVTSGVYQRTLTHNHRTYHHIFDKATGYPLATNQASLTIIAQSSVVAEMWSTQLFGLPLSKIAAIVAKTPSIAAIVVDSAEQIWLSDERLLTTDVSKLIET